MGTPTQGAVMRISIMPPRMRTQSIGRPAAESLGGGTGERVGSGERGRRPRECNDERIDELNGQGNDLEPLTRHVGSGCSYKEFLACNPKEYDGKGGAVVLTRWIEKMEFVHDIVLLGLKRLHGFLEVTTAQVLVPQTVQENGTSVTKMSIPVTAEGEANKKNDVKARGFATTWHFPNDINFIQSLWWMNKPEVETMSIDDLYKNYKIVGQKVKKFVGTSSGAQNLAFMTALSTSSTNDANTASPQVVAS
ncbi:hypothetical protein Tco_1056951 [Tanacetum coccineum]|uniref:Reverse transcriptase domain-containing protein n=1 Tax=Tanacetum coccineum TaxID=301880 RepID=A0ABQ5H4S0_9ASTR